ncbi:MAG: ATP-binding protein, partial [Anaerolineae bacterium]
LQVLVQHEKPFLVFDWKRNYRDLLTRPEFRDVAVYTIGRDVAPLQFNPLIPPPGTDPKTWLKKLNEVIAHAYCLGNGVLFLLQQAVDAAYAQAGVYDQTVQRFPTFRDVLAKARTMDTRGREAGWLSSTLRALSSLCFGGMGELLNSSGNRSIDRILEGNVILELDGLSQADKTFFVQACLLYLHHKKMAENVRERFDRCILIEEAHHILSGQRTSLTGAESVMDTTYREIREFGVSLVLLDQMPSKLSGFALANSYATICMSMSNRADINAMSQSLLLDSGKDILGTLEVGQAVVKLQGRIPRPFLIAIPEFQIEKGRVTDEQIRAYMQERLSELETEDPLLEQIVSDEGQDVVKKEPDDAVGQLELAFLEDLLDWPDSGVAARYRRLGLSVRQGQKLKAQLAKEGLVEEGLEHTSTGRRRVVRLTKKGAQVLSQARPAA